MRIPPGTRVSLDYLYTVANQYSVLPTKHKPFDTGVVLPFPEMKALPPDTNELLTAVHWDDDVGCGIPHPEEGLSFTLIRTQLLIPAPRTLKQILSTPSSPSSSTS